MEQNVTRSLSLTAFFLLDIKKKSFDKKNFFFFLLFFYQIETATRTENNWRQKPMVEMFSNCCWWYCWSIALNLLVISSSKNLLNFYSSQLYILLPFFVQLKYSIANNSSINVSGQQLIVCHSIQSFHHFKRHHCNFFFVD